MATTIQNVNLANTFGEWVNTTNETVTAYNTIYASDFTKPSGTLYLTASGTPLVVANTASFTGLVDIASQGSLLVRNNAEIQNQLFLTNKNGGSTSTVVLTANGVANVQYISILGAGLSANVSNNMAIGGTLVITGNTTTSANLIVTKDITGNNQTLTNHLNVGGHVYVTDYLSVAGKSYHSGATYLNSTLQVGDNTEIERLDVNTNVLTVTFNSSGMSRVNDLVSNTALVTPMVHASVAANVQYLSSNTDVVVSRTTTTNNLQANTAANTRTLSVTGTSSTDYLQANTAANTRTLSVTGTSFTDFLQANTAANTRTMSVTGATLTDTLQANTSVNTPISNAATIITRTLQANSSVNTAYVNTASISVGGPATVSSLTSNTGITITTGNLVANSGTVYGSLISTPLLRFSSTLLGDGGTSGATTVTAGAGNFGTVSVTGNFTINGSTIYNSDTFTLNAGASANQNGSIVNYRPNGANATLRWTETSKWWEIRDVENPTYYNRILTANDYTSINTTSSTTTATIHNNIAANVVSLQTQMTANAVSANAVITTANTNMKNYVDVADTTTRSWLSSNVTTLQTQITANSISANAVITTANTNMKNYVDVANTNMKIYVDGNFLKVASGGSTQTISSDVTVTGNLVVSGTTTTVNSQTVDVADSLIKLAKNNTVADTIDMGFYGPYSSGGVTRYTGLFRKATDSGKYYLAQGIVDDPTSNTIAQYGNTYRATLDGNFTGGTVSGLASPILVADGGSGTTTSTGTAGSIVLSDSPTLTGTPLSPTAANSTYTTQIATTAFVQNANTLMKTYVDGNKVASVTGTSGRIVITGTSTAPVLNLATTAVTAGTYGGTASIPSIIIDSHGRATFAGNNAIAAASLSGQVPITLGGTGAANKADALTNLLPTGTTSGYVLTTGGPGTFYWGPGGGGGGGTSTQGTNIETTRVSYTATAGQTVFTGVGTYVIGKGQLRVYINGVRQSLSDYSETSTTSFTLNVGATLGDVVFAEVDGYNTYVQEASLTNYNPTGALSSTNVESALNELEAEKMPLVGGTFLGTVRFPTSNTSYAPIIIPAGSVLTSNVAGAVEFNGTRLFITNSSNVRKSLAHNEDPFYIGTTQFLVTRTSASQKLTGVSIDGTADALVTSGNYQVNSFGVGTTPSGTAGEIRAAGTITAWYSDERLKENIKPISDALSKVASLRGVTFNSNNVAAQYGYTNKNEQVGVIAQDVEKVLPQVVVAAPFDIGQNEDGSEFSLSGANYKTVHYEKLVPLLIEAIKELKQEIELLKNK